MSVTDSSLLMSLLAVLSNVCLRLNGGLIGSWLAFLTIELIGYKTIYNCAIYAV